MVDEEDVNVNEKSWFLWMKNKITWKNFKRFLLDPILKGKTSF